MRRTATSACQSAGYRGVFCSGRQFLVGQVLLREVLSHPLQPFVEDRGQAAADLAVHEHQHFAFAVEPAAEVVVDHLLAEVLHHRAIGAPAKGLGDVQPIAVQRPQLDDAEAIELEQVLHALGIAEGVAGDDLLEGPWLRQQIAIAAAACGRRRPLSPDRVSARCAWVRVGNLAREFGEVGLHHAQTSSTRDSGISPRANIRLMLDSAMPS